MLLRDARFCAVDIETTGLNLKKDAIISIACIPIVQLKILMGNHFYSLVKPAQYSIEAMRYHGISMENLLHAPSFKDIAGKVLQHMDGILVGQSVEFDYTFLRRIFKSVGVKLRRDFLDIALIERWLRWTERIEDADLSFEGIMARYGLREYYRHNALADAYFAAQIFQLQMSRSTALGVDSVEKLIKSVRSCRDTDSCVTFL